MQGKLVGGRYRIEQRLGKGAFGETYKAYDAHLPKHPYCVVKHLRPINTSPQVLEIAKRLFYKEAEILAELGEHPQIPRLYAYFVEGEDFYLVQEFVDGHSLDQEMQGQWSPEKVHDFVVEMMNLLEFVHSKGVIHRDIKPTNILRRKADNKLVLIDFGAIKEVSQTAMADSGLLTTSIVIGTRGYMAPEQAYGKPRFGSDIYSVGMIAIEALTGKKLRELDEDTDTGELLWKGQVSHAGSLVDIVSKMTLYDHKARYKKTNQVLIDLMSLAEFKTAPTQEQPSTPVEAPTDTESNSEVVTTNQPPVETQKQEEIKQPTIRKTELIDGNVTTEKQLVTAQDRRVVRGEGTAWLVALLVTFGIFVIMLVTPAYVSLLIVIGSAIWAAFDAHKLGLSRYETGLHSPIALFAGILGIWIVVFPWYLIVRASILRGEAELKTSNSVLIDGVRLFLLIISVICPFIYLPSVAYIINNIKNNINNIIFISFVSSTLTPEELLASAIRSYYLEQNYADAIQKLDALLKKQPDNIDALILRGKAKYESGNSQGGVNDFQKAIKLDDSQRSSVSIFLNKIGDARLLNGDDKGAINDYSYAIQLDPNDAVAYHNRGYVKQRTR
jgi:serine/threonine protein kinase